MRPERVPICKPLEKFIEVEVALLGNGYAKVDTTPEFVIVKLGYVPVTEMPAPFVRETVWSGDEFEITIVFEFVVVERPMPAPADSVLNLS